VLEVKRGPKGAYYNLSAEQIKAFQAKGQLPDPLPPYAIDPVMMAFAYSLWLLVPIVLLGPFMSRIWRKLRGIEEKRA
jgi:hypothetical protein